LKNRQNGLKWGKEEMGISKRKSNRYKTFRVVENFFGLQGQEQEKRTETGRKKPRTCGAFMDSFLFFVVL
jgi:hypothetical protein